MYFQILHVYVFIIYYSWKGWGSSKRDGFRCSFGEKKKKSWVSMEYRRTTVCNRSSETLVRIFPTRKMIYYRFFVSYSIRLSYWNVLYLKFKCIYNSSLQLKIILRTYCSKETLKWFLKKMIYYREVI